jgi:antitoxin MazE
MFGLAKATGQNILPVKRELYRQCCHIANSTIMSTKELKEMDMRAVVKKWGNSASVRIPAAIMAATKIELDSAVDVREEDGRIVIEPIRTPEINLDELIESITSDNLHDEMDFGARVGKEAF